MELLKILKDLKEKEITKEDLISLAKYINLKKATINIEELKTETYSELKQYIIDLSFRIDTNIEVFPIKTASYVKSYLEELLFRIMIREKQNSKNENVETI